MERSEFVARLDEELDTDAYAKLDASANGLQVGSLEGEVESVAFAADAVEETIADAAERDVDVLVTHHGLVWGGLDRVTGRDYDRIAPLVENDVALYVSHLPLDGHQEFGNAAGVADLLDLGNRAPFGRLGPEYVGTQGTLPEPLAASELAGLLDDALDTGPASVRILDFGPDDIEDVAVLTGSGADWLDEAVDAGADALVTGEGKGKLYHEAKESGVTVFLAGHYATETFGVETLQGLVDDWGIDTTFLDYPTGL